MAARRKFKPKSCRASDRARRAFELRISGQSYRAIGDALGCSMQEAFRLVSTALAECEQQTAESAKELRRIELDRVDALIATLWPRRRSERVADTVLRAQAMRVRLLGLEAPVQHEVSMLTAEEREARLRELTEQARASQEDACKP